METPVTAPNPRRGRALGGRAGAAPSRKPARVLIVDDDAAIRMLCSINLQLEGLEVVEAADGRRALALVRSERPDLVLTDVAMPSFDGFQLAEALRGDEHTREIPLIFLSGETTEAHRARAHTLGALAYLTKPFDPPTLVSLVTDALARAGKRPLAAPQPAA